MTALIAYSNLLRAATVVSEQTETNFTTSNALDGRTSSQVGFVSGATREIIFDLGSQKNITTFCAAKHNLGTVSATITYTGSNTSSSGPWTAITSVAYSSDNVNIKNITLVSYRWVRIEVSGMSSNAYIADLFIGDALVLPRGMFSGFIRPEHYDQDTIKSNLTANGALVGLSVIQKPKKCKIHFKNYEPSWFESNWENLITSMKLYPAYFSWDLTKKGIYCWLSSKPSAPSYNANRKQSVTLTVDGFI